MKQEDRETLSKLVSFCGVIDEDALYRFRIVEKILLVEFFQPEFDILRKEICRCFITASYHACITLTNLLLERYCKILLVYHETGFKTIDDVEDLETGFDSANKKYMDKDLSQTLNACKRFGFITKEDKNKLDGYREVFRNGYGHADPQKILGDAKGGFVFGNLSGDKPGEFKELTYSKIPMFHGFAVEAHSKKNALPYFIEEENLIRMTINNIQSDEFKLKYDILEIVMKNKKEDE